MDDYEDLLREYDERCRRESRWMLAALVVCVTLAGALIYMTDVLTR
jgi:hypothetical protein